MNALCESLEGRTLFSASSIAQTEANTVLADIGAMKAEFTSAIATNRADETAVINELKASYQGITGAPYRRDMLYLAFLKSESAHAIAVDSKDMASVIAIGRANLTRVFSALQMSNARPGDASEDRLAYVVGNMQNALSAAQSKLAMDINVGTSNESLDIPQPFLVGDENVITARNTMVSDNTAFYQAIQSDISTTNNDTAIFASNFGRLVPG